MNACCGLDLRIGTKVVAVLSSIICVLVVIAFIVRLTSAEPELLNDSLGIAVAIVYIILGAILYSGAVQSAVWKCEAWIAGGLILCGFQIRSVSNTIQNWEHTGPLLLAVDVVSIGVISWFVLVVFTFTKQITTRA